MRLNKKICESVDKLFDILEKTMFAILLVFFGVHLYYSQKMVTQLAEQDALIRRMQFKDSISACYFPIEDRDSVLIYSPVYRNGQPLTYDGLRRENDSLQQQLRLRDALLKMAAKDFSFVYSMSEDEQENSWVLTVSGAQEK